MKKIILLATLAFSINAFAQVPINGLIGYWPFSGNSNDESGAGNNGTVNGATLTTDRFGNLNSAYSFNGASDFIQNNLNGPTSDSSRTISYWMKSILNQEDMTVVGYGDNNDYEDFHIWHNWGCNGININISNAAITYNTGALNNNWNHFVVVFDNDLGSSLTNVKLYKNGILLSNTCTTYGSGNINTGNTYPVTIGKYHASNLHYFNGALDDVRIYNVAIDSSGINALYNEGICYTYITVTDTLIINTTLTSLNPVTYQNTIKIYPNPTNDHITIDNGNITNLTGYQMKITNSLGQQVFQSAINQNQFYVSLSTWTGNGIYFVHIIDEQGNTIDIKKIILQ